MPATSRRKPEWVITTLAALSAFCVYTCMYAFRKPFTAAGFEEESLWGVDYKIWLVIAQTMGYTVSKFFGIRFIAGMKSDNRAVTIIRLIAIAWLALLFFALFPSPFNILFLLINGFPLGVIYGLVFSYLEGRRTTEMLGAVLAASFIFASGFTQSVGKFVMLQWNVSEWWMPWVTGLIFFVPLIFFTWLLEKTPAPGFKDRKARTQRLPMTKKDRQGFLRTFMPGLVMLILAYVMLTMIRDYRSNFASNIWNELGYSNDAAVFTQSELPASLVVLLMMSLLIFVRKNIYALLINHLVIVTGFLIAIGSTLLYTRGELSAFWWMTFSGVGLYMGYVPFNCMLFERLIASFKYVSNAGFIIYVADSFGYLGSDVVLLVKNFMQVDVSWSDFLVKMVLLVSVTGMLLVIFSAIYFKRKYQSYFPSSNPYLNYG
jgi:Family of unknown function (DUF5690)